MSSRPEAVSYQPVPEGEPAQTASSYERAFDVVLATLALVLLSPLLLLIAVAILLEDGRPIFFFQARVGRGKEQFRLCKFRSMVADADQEMHQRHVLDTVNGFATLRLIDDPRITRVGKVIRRWSLDELPNLWNVIVGDMSLVGPRPLVPYEADAISPSHHRRFSIRPGVTGLAQVSGRLEMTHEERLDLDATYANDRTLLNDMKILVRTVPTMVKQRG